MGPISDPQHVTLVANTATTVTLGRAAHKITVVNVDGAAAVYFNVNETGDPTVAGNGCWVLPAAIGALDLPVTGTTATVVKLISSGTPKVSVGVVA